MSGCVTVTGPPSLDLLEEARDHAAVAAQHVAEADDARTGGRRSASACATISSATRLVAPMTLEGFTALSVEIRTKRSTPWRVGGLRHDPRAAHVVLDRLAGVLLHERHVLVRRRVEDDLRPVLAQDLVEPRRVGDVPDDRDTAPKCEPGPRAPSESRAGCSRSARTSQRGRLEPGDLPAQLGPDRSRPRRSPSPAARQSDASPSRIEPDRRARQQILDRQAADLRRARPCRR